MSNGISWQSPGLRWLLAAVAVAVLGSGPLTAGPDPSLGLAGISPS
jgi:hypothetical protein